MLLIFFFRNTPKGHACLCIEEDWSVERAEKVLEDELAKAWHDVDHFLLEKAFSSTAQNRQMEIKRLGGNVSAIIEKFPF